MKVIFVANQEQENEIKELVEKVYSDIFPIYFSDEMIKDFERKNVLHISSGQFQYFRTIKEAYSVITSLQTIISILEIPKHLAEYENLFLNNSQILNKYGLFFPFDYKHFSQESHVKNDYLSVYAKAANELLI